MQNEIYKGIIQQGRPGNETNNALQMEAKSPSCDTVLKKMVRNALFTYTTEPIQWLNVYKDQVWDMSYKLCSASRLVLWLQMQQVRSGCLPRHYLPYPLHTVFSLLRLLDGLQNIRVVSEPSRCISAAYTVLLCKVIIVFDGHSLRVAFKIQPCPVQP